MDTKELKALGAYKNLLIKMIISDGLCEPLMDLLMPKLDEPSLDKIDNFLGGVFELNGESIKLPGRIYDVPFIYTTITDEVNVICIDTNTIRSSGSIKEMGITFSVMCHKNNLRLGAADKKKYADMGYYGNRLDIAVAILNDIVGHSREFGIGELNLVQFNPVTAYYPNDNFFGKVMQYSCSDFMKYFNHECMGR